MLYHKRVKLPIYSGYITMFVYDKETDFASYDKKNKIIDRKLIPDAVAFVNDSTFYSKKLHYFTIEIIFKQEHFSFVTPGTLAHEATHVADSIFYFIGAKHSPKNPEPYAYLLGYIMDTLYLFISEYESYIKRGDRKLPGNDQTKRAV